MINNEFASENRWAALREDRNQNFEVLLQKQKAYWQEKLITPLPILELTKNNLRSQKDLLLKSQNALSSTRTEAKSDISSIETAEISPKLYLQLQEFTQRENCSLFIPILAACQAVLIRYTGQEDIIIGTVGASRFHNSEPVASSQLINAIALRTNVTADLTVKELVARTTKTVQEAALYQDYPWEKLTEDLGTESIFQVMLVPCQMSFELSDTAINPENLTQIGGLNNNFEIKIFVVPTKQSLVLKCEYDSELFESATIQRLLGHLQTLLAGLVAHPEKDLASLPLLSEAEKQQLLVQWNNNQQEYPQDHCIHHLIEQQVATTPDAIAVVWGEEKLTYQELNHKANQLAHYLKALGVKAETLVGICVERSLEMIVGLLAILKAGAAYVPLDPSYPTERLTYMLEDAEVAIVLTQANLVAYLEENVIQAENINLDINLVCLDSDLAPKKIDIRIGS